MKREVWVGCVEDDKEAKPLELYTGQWTHVKKIEIHVSRWIPVSERMPDACHVGEEFLVIRLGRKTAAKLFKNDEGKLYFNHSEVTCWLETPPLPVDEFEKFLWDYMEKTQLNFASKDLKDHMRATWNAAKEYNGPRP